MNVTIHFQTPPHGPIYINLLLSPFPTFFSFRHQIPFPSLSLSLHTFSLITADFTMSDLEWVDVALSDDSLVVDLLLRLNRPPSPPLPLDWSVRQPRSKPILPRHTSDSAARASPTTPLTWSSSGGGGGGGFVDASDAARSKVPIRFGFRFFLFRLCFVFSCSEKEKKKKKKIQSVHANIRKYPSVGDLSEFVFSEPFSSNSQLRIYPSFSPHRRRLLRPFFHNYPNTHFSQWWNGTTPFLFSPNGWPLLDANGSKRVGSNGIPKKGILVIRILHNKRKKCHTQASVKESNPFLFFPNKLHLEYKIIEISPKSNSQTLVCTTRVIFVIHP